MRPRSPDEVERKVHSPCPLIFEPIAKPKIWGGRRLETLLSKSLPPGDAIGETWECFDLPEACSIVARGPARGKSLRELIETWGESSLLGRARLLHGHFPLLIKFLDAELDLSVQVHPAPADAAGAPGGKHEAWHILNARPDSCIWRGLKDGASVEALAAAVRTRPAAALEYVQRIPVRPGQTYYIPAGTPHALGAGVVVAEVQTPSTTTYRLYDFDRDRPADDAGLHVEESIACLRTNADFAAFEKRSHVTSLFTTVTRLVTCPSFVIEKVRFLGELEQEIPYAELVMWIVLDGRGEVLFGAGDSLSFGRGDVVILPARLEKGVLRTVTDCSWLEVTVPAGSDLAEYPRPDQGSLAESPDSAERSPFVPLNISLPHTRPGE